MRLNISKIIKTSIVFSLALSVFFVLNFRSSNAQTTSSININVNPAIKVSTFNNKMLGVGMVNWEHSWGKLFPNEVPGLAQAFKAARVGMIRYAGGNWTNSVGWDRVAQRNPYTTWTKNGNTYSFHYGTNEIDSLGKFAGTVGANVMIEVNISENDPAMWADMVKYANIEKGYNFKYWELGNELDLETKEGITPDIYQARLKTYIDAMKAVDPTIKIVAGVPAAAHDAPRLGYDNSVTSMSQFLIKSAQTITQTGKRADSLSYHWYQECGKTTVDSLFEFQIANTPYTSWVNNYSRIWGKIAPNRIHEEIIDPYMSGVPHELGVTEINYNACNYDHVLNGNHLNALWAIDVLGRLAYNGVEYSTWYEGYGTQGYALVYPDVNDTCINGSGGCTSKVMLRPSYYGLYMLGNYFGTDMVQATSSNEKSVSVIASTDPADVGKLKLMLTNTTSSDQVVSINLSTYNAKSATAYVLESNNPDDLSATSNTDQSSTNINGIKLDGMNVAGSASQIKPIGVALSGSVFTYTLPRYTATALILSTEAGTVPTPTISNIPTNTPGVSPIPSPAPVVIGPAAYPLKKLAGARYLVDQNNNPYFINAEAPWSLIGEVSKEDADLYLKDAKAKGINTIITTLTESYYTTHFKNGDKNRPTNFYGEEPFTFHTETGLITLPDFSKPNEAYFAHADWVINKANEYGIQVVLAPNYLGCCGDGYYDELSNSGTTTSIASAYGTFIGTRYKNFPNIIYVWGNDLLPGNVRSKIDAMAKAAKAADPNHLHTYHASPENSSLDTWSLTPSNTTYASWLDINSVYTYLPVQDEVQFAYKNSSLPFFLFESHYEKDWNNKPALEVRKEAYIGVLSGASGNGYGNNPIWHMNATTINGITDSWKNHLNDEGRNDLIHFYNLFLSRNWTGLVPDLDHTVLTSGYGSGGDFAGASRTSDGSTIIVYTPSQKNLTLDLSKVSGPARSWWFNPKDGVSIEIGTFTNSGSKVFTPPSSGDWVLVVDDANKNYQAPGLVTPQVTPIPTSSISITLAPFPSLGDINNDGIINLSDLMVLKSDFGKSNSPSDLNKDGLVNILDYSILSHNYGMKISDTLTPSPVAITNIPTQPPIPQSTPTPVPQTTIVPSPTPLPLPSTTACWPSAQPAGALATQPPPVFCSIVNSGLDTSSQTTNGWLDEFNHNLSFANFANTNYVTYDNLSIFKSINWRHSNHWMVDIAPESQINSQYNSVVGGSMIRPNRSFKFENGKLVVEADFAAGHQDYENLKGWGEIVVSTGSKPTQYRKDGLYAYDMFGPGTWTLGMRMQADRNSIASLIDPNDIRLWEMSFFQQVGTTNTGGGAFGGGEKYWRYCTSGTDPDEKCRDRFRLELTKTSVTLYVNGFLYFQQTGIPPLPDQLTNGDIYVYFASMTARSNADTIRFHWDRLSVNPTTGPSVAPGFIVQ